MRDSRKREGSLYSDTSSQNWSRSSSPIREDDGLGPKWRLYRRRRYIVAIFVYLGYLVMYAVRTNLSITLTAMVIGHGIHEELGDYDWDMILEGHVLASLYYGCLLLPLIGGYAACRYCSVFFFGIGVGFPVFISMYREYFVKVHFGGLIALLFVEGLFQGMVIPSSMAIWGQWLPLLESNTVIPLSHSGAYVGGTIAMVLSGLIILNLEWEAVFLLFGAFGSLWYGFWVARVYRTPREDPKIHPNELVCLDYYALRNLKTVKHPWKKIFTSLPVYALCATHFAIAWGQYTFSQLPMYLQDVHRYSLMDAGFLSSIPYVILLILMPIIGYISYLLLRRNIMTATHVRKIFICVGFALEGLCFLLMGLVNDKMYSIILVAGAAVAAALSEPHFYVNILELAPQHATIVAAMTTTCSAMAGIASSLLTGYLVPNKSLEEWKIIFRIAAGVHWFSVVCYSIFGSGERALWAREDKKSYVGSTISSITTSSSTME